MNLQRIFEDKPLFKECIEALDAEVLSVEETLKLKELFKKLYPIAAWGKIDWNKIENKIVVGYEPQGIITALERLLTDQFDPSVYILWSTKVRMIRTNIYKIIDHFDDVTCVSFEKFIFNPRQGYIIEILPSDLITIGVIKK